jgi:ArsR family transcriptional regulator, lead/cadmium/zinc/bismuth-responsive transcriptional repressor
MDAQIQIKTEGCEATIIHQDQTAIAAESLIAAPTAAALARTFQALADPTRLRLLSALAATELCVCDLAAVLEMTQSAVSHQLSLLRSLRIVKGRRAGREIFYSLDDEHVQELFSLGLKHIKHD